MGLKHEMMAWMMVGKTDKRRLVAEGKAKKIDMEVATRLGSSDGVTKGEETGIAVARKRLGKETKVVEDPLMNHRAIVLAEAKGLQKVGDSSIREVSHS